MRHAPFAVALLSAALSLASGSSLAANWSGSLGIDNLRLSVIDLTPSDNQAAGFSFTGEHSALLLVYDRTPGATDRDRVRRIGQGESVTEQLAGGHIQANINGIGNFRFDTSTSPTGLPRATFFYQQKSQLVLAPHSVLLLTGTASTQQTQQLNSPWYTSGFASAKLFDGKNYSNSSSFRRDRFETPNWTTPEEFTLSFANFSDSAQLVGLELGASYSVATMVPEPGSYAMLGSGLLLLSGWVRRRRSAALSN
ncbi:PEP-CTERM sorting domain-containing protein [Massilia sp. YIM B04103]|uniref:PEP-CTERM sorting domain-containing protein n=1 Tax=Massilia sp. YIM B04103 TaxID=2963106 RepID=UPI00210CB4BB|nr:PEP-CTERM sorting domain-containing protein [Massilia sp. YIM B04103]